MSTLMRFVGGSLFAFVLAGTGLAQENRAPIENPQKPVAATPLVTATATAKRVRFVSPGTVVQLRLEVYNEAGQKLFDTELHGGNVLDWHLQDGAGQDLQSGSYACVLTIKSLSGRLSQRIGLLTVNDKQAVIEAAEGAHLSLAQQQAIGPVEGNATLTIRQESEGEAITAVTHDGTEGQLTSTKGALTFRTGDIFSGKEKEQMRLTEDGRLGIGTSKPRAKLDVAGTISAQRFLIAKPKVAVADQTEILEADATATDSADVEALVAGTGTKERIAKWVDSEGTLGDSVIAESSGNIGIGTPSATHKLDVQNPGANGAIRSVNESFGVRGLISEQHSSNVVGAIFVGLKSRGTLAAPTAVVPNDFGAFFSNKWYDGTSYVQSGAFGFTVDGPVSNGVVPTRLSFVTSTTSGDGPTAHGVERMTILSGGNAGIGTTAPAARLHVAGSSSSTATPIAIVESSGVQMPISFRRAGTEHARIRANSAGDLVFATTNGSDKDILFRAGDDTSTDMFIQSSTGNVGIGTTSPDAKLDVNNGTILSSGTTGGRLGANNPNNQSASVNLDWFNDTARIRYGGTGAGAANGLVIQGQGDATKVTIGDNGSVNAASNVFAGGKLFFVDTAVESGGPPLDLCGREVSSIGPDPFQITLCSSSIRYKTDVRGFTPGLEMVSQLRPVGFRWKGSNSADVGLIAEEVALVEPLLVTRNSKGEIEGVKYDRIGVVLLNAVQEQQAQIKEQQQQLQAKDKRIANLAASLARYESRLESLERFVARGKRTKRQVTARVNSTRTRGIRRATPLKAD